MANDDSVGNIDFGGRFAQQFNNCHWSPRPNENHHQIINNPTSSTPVASDNSISDSAYDSFQIINLNGTTSTSGASPKLLQIDPWSGASTTSTNNSSTIKLPLEISTLAQTNVNIDPIERLVSLHRTAASFSEPQYTWSGQLPSRSYKNPVYSCKVFLGGVPWDVTESGLIDTFGRFGSLRVQWPPNNNHNNNNNNHNINHGTNNNNHNHRRGGNTQRKAGYVYLIYESERYVKSLLKACTQDFGTGSHPEKYYYQLSSRRMRYKEVQVIPWILADSNYIRNQNFGKPDLHRTVFVGALHGMLTAEGLATIMNDLFRNVAYVGIDSDKHKYPIGSGRVTFSSQRSYLKAVSAGFIEVKSAQFCKKIQVDPYVESSECSTCHVQNGPIFCRDCLRYFCKTCWNWHHGTNQEHHPLMRKRRDNNNNNNSNINSS